MKKLIAYVDGSYNIKIHQCSYGVVTIDEEANDMSYFGALIDDIYYCNMRNVGGEIIAAQEAMKYALNNKYDEVTIYYDYSGIAEWALDHWKANNKCTARYKEFYKDITKNIKVKFVWVKGHSKNKYNDMVDLIAKRFAGIE